MTSWTELFADRPIVIDGGLSTQLARHEAPSSGALWTAAVLLDRPEAVVSAHSDFAAAGADVVISASYQVSRVGFVEAGWTAADADAALRASVALARAGATSVDRDVRVAASVGPYGAVLHDGSEYRGRYGLSAAELVDFHAPRIDVLARAQPDLLAVETIPDVAEGEALAQVLDGVPEVPAWMSFSASDGAHTAAGQPIEEAALLAASIASVVAVGVNCTAPEHIGELVARIRAVTGLPIVAYANAGGSWDVAASAWTRESVGRPAFSAEQVRAWRAAGATGVGGCCGTDAATVAFIASVGTGT